MNVLVPLPGICLSAYQPDQTRGPKGHDADRKCADARVGPRVAVDYADSGSSQGEPLLFLGRGSSDDRRSAAEGDSPNSARYATEKRPNSQKPQLLAIGHGGHRWIGPP